MKSWYKNWDVISPIFKFSMEVRKIIYTTNAIESLNSGYRRLNKQRSVFPSDTALLKALYLATHEITKKWTVPLRNWGQVPWESWRSCIRTGSAEQRGYQSVFIPLRFIATD
jgi:transposase-like protein